MEREEEGRVGLWLARSCMYQLQLLQPKRLLLLRIGADKLIFSKSIGTRHPKTLSMASHSLLKLILFISLTTSRLMECITN